MAGFGCCTGKSSFGGGRPEIFGKKENTDTCVAAYTIEGLITVLEDPGQTTWFNLETTITRIVRCLAEGVQFKNRPIPLVHCRGAGLTNVSTHCGDEGLGFAESILRVDIVPCEGKWKPDVGHPMDVFTKGGPLLPPPSQRGICAEFTTQYCEKIMDCDCKKKLKHTMPPLLNAPDGCNLVKKLDYRSMSPNSPTFGKHPLAIKWWNQYVGPKKRKFFGGEQPRQYLHGGDHISLDILKLVEDALPNNIVPPKYCCSQTGSFGIQEG